MYFYLQLCYLKKNNPNLCSSGIYYANGEQKINEINRNKKVIENKKGGSNNKDLKNNLLYPSNSNKVPSYYFDLNTTVGGRPEIVRSDKDETYFLDDLKNFNKTRKFNFISIRSSIY